jgi:uncharacterized membrane protein YdbT with pleckstrin-like domain
MREEVGVAFPEESLSQGEEVRLHLHPHGIVLFWPVVLAIVIIGGSAAAAVFASLTGVGLYVVLGIAAVLLVWLVLVPYIVWRSTHYVFTNKQVLFRTGVIRREERGIPLSKINDVKANQSLFDRILGSGDLTVESAGEHGQSVLHTIPSVVKVMNTLKDLVAHDHDKHSLDEDELRSALKEHREAGGTL